MTLEPTVLLLLTHKFNRHLSVLDYFTIQQMRYNEAIIILSYSHLSVITVHSKFKFRVENCTYSHTETKITVNLF